MIEAVAMDHNNNVTELGMTVYRLPKEVRPVDRYALLIGAGSDEASANVDELRKIFANPYLGQMSEGDVVAKKFEDLTAGNLDTTISEFARMPRAGELAFVYIAAPANTSEAGLGSGGEVSLRDLQRSLEQGLATNRIVLRLDLDWDTASEDLEVVEEMGTVPASWGVLTSAEFATPSMESNGRTLFGDALVRALRGDEADFSTLTIERLFDQVLNTVATESGEKAIPDTDGRIDPNTVVVEYE